MRTLKFKTFPALALGLLSAVCLLAQQQPVTSPAGLSTTKHTAATKASPSRQTKKRSKPAVARKQAKSTPPISEPLSAPAANPTPVPTPEEAQPQSSPQIDELPEAKPEKLSLPTPEARLRAQLLVVEEMAANGKKQEALAELRLLAAEDRYDPTGFYNVANAFARLDATDAAISVYRKAIEQRNGKYSRASNNLGVLLLRQGFWDQAYEALLTALRNENFHYAEASYNLGRLYAARGDMDLAVREWRRAVKVDPNHQGAVRALGSDRSLSRSKPESPVSSELVSSPTSSARNELTSARTPVARTFTLDAESHELLQRARTDHERGRYEEAVSGFRRVIARNGGFFSPANLELSYSLIELRRNDEAIAELLRVAEKDGARFPISYYHLGRLYEQRGDLQEAEVNYLRATQSHQTENAQSLLNLSTVREKRGDFAGALVAMENYLKRKEKLGQKPDWAEARLKELREKGAAATDPPRQ